MVTYRYIGPKSAKSLVIDDAAALWLARMIVGEGGENCSQYKAVVLSWAIINRFMLWGGRWRYKSFIKLMRAFSQPINPRWMTGGDLALKHVGRNAASAARLARRARVCALTWAQIPRRIRNVVRRIQDGVEPYPVFGIDRDRVTNWASLPSTPNKFSWGVDVDGDWFFEDQNIVPGSVVVE